jgi:hypothetical protein
VHWTLADSVSTLRISSERAVGVVFVFVVGVGVVVIGVVVVAVVV